MRYALRAVLWVAVGPLMAGSGVLPPVPAEPRPRVRPWAQAAPMDPAKLPQATTFARLTGLPNDSTAFAVTDGQVVHPLKPIPVYAAPGGRPVAGLPATELGAPTWVPVIQTEPGWRRVLLPSRPNHSTGWLFADRAAAKDLVIRYSVYVVRVELGARRLTVTEHGHPLGSWTVAVGALVTPTPVGRTYVLAHIEPSRPTYSPLILPLGTHSDTLDFFGGGPGTVALHGWPDRRVFGRQVSHGCVRVPPRALRVLSRIPLGSLVLITK